MTKKIFLILTLLTAVFAEDRATYVGDKACAECHSKEVKEWKGSHHDLAMMVADEKSVKGDFNNAKFNYNGIITTFFKKGDKFMVNTDSEDGSLKDYEISYTFGVYPLQQYMIKFPKGNIQVMDIAWDSRSKEEGGQRWYHIHADDNVTAGDVLHWTGQNFNWNYMCADCHSTNLKKNYDVETKSYHTTWDIINVSCEACHGPASKHMEWSKTPHKELSNKGFALSFKNKKWKWDVNTKEKKGGTDHQEIEVCAKCHSRRSQLDDDFTPGDKFSDHYLSTMLAENLYFPDGKIQDEVYVYDSFLQSKMYAAGVTCTDCHNPHTLERKSKGDKVCSQCHSEEKYMATSHHKHKEGGEGASCVSCHMPARTYMGVDSRNDHSFRVPRPDVSVEMKEVPNACNLCHTDKDPQWATDAMKKWYGKIPVGKQNFAHSLQALRSNSKDAPKNLYEVLMSDAPDIAKATATAYLGNYPSKQTYTTTLQMLGRSDAQIRRSALQALEAFPPKMRMKKTFEMLNDPVKIVRIEAARQLAAFSLGEVDKKTKDLLEKAFDEYEKTLLFTAERPESQLSLGVFYTNRKMLEKARMAYEEAIRLQPQFVPAYINYNEFLLRSGESQKGFDILQKGLANVPEIAILHHALGLWYVRNKESEKAIVELKKAAQLDEGNARFSYVYAIAIGEKDPKEAIKILEEAYPKHTGNLQIVSGLVYYYKQTGDAKKSEMYEKKLKDLQNFSVR
ncbi:multiheme c-type cytochrome [Sulfurovum sp. CS9]|uniref:multiheme c-type cytochrome n=1 Tax=Sulfurovum sp. CS9 TaxID=3391146 RepID=UPI0039EAEB2B